VSTPWRDQGYSTASTIAADANTTLYGPVASTVDMVLQPSYYKQFGDQDDTFGYVAYLNKASRGSIANGDQYFRQASGSGVHLHMSVERSASVDEYDEISKFDPVKVLTEILALCSALMGAAAIGLMLTEESIVLVARRLGRPIPAFSSQHVHKDPIAGSHPHGHGHGHSDDKESEEVDKSSGYHGAHVSRTSGVQETETPLLVAPAMDPGPVYAQQVVSTTPAFAPALAPASASDGSFSAQHEGSATLEAEATLDVHEDSVRVLC